MSICRSAPGHPRPMHRRPRAMAMLVGWMLLAPLWPASAAIFQTNDVVVFLGGAAVVAGDRAGTVETVLTLGHPGWRLRFRTLAWEGDTVFGSPRELNFPSLTESLRRYRASVVCAQFGALESLDPAITADAFRTAYRQLLEAITNAGARAVLVVPPLFEPHPPPLPDLGAANDRLAKLADVIHTLVAERRLAVVDLRTAWSEARGPGPWTYDGREATPAGHRAIAAAWARQLGLVTLADRAATSGLWEQPDVSELHRAVNLKNRLWFNYWRPMNWAFLAGDRTEQQASRDHRDPKRRWFPAEMEEYPPLIDEADGRIESLAAQFRSLP